MTNLQTFQANICYTAAGILIHEGRILLIKHKKLGLWLNPGGHIEANELNHKAAEREFYEETGVRVKAVDLLGLDGGPETEFVPNPIASNLHWVSKENYWSRVQAKGITDPQWKKGCEQHLNFLFLVQQVANLDLTFNRDETFGLEWFTHEQLAQIELTPSVRTEIELGYQMGASLSPNR